MTTPSTRPGWLLLIVALIGVTWLRPLDEFAERQIDAGFQRALTTFAAARTINAVLSAAQSTTVEVKIGVGGSIQPGAVLEPIDDLVEQFSSLMLAATVAFASERLLLLALSSWPFCLLVSAMLLLVGLLTLRARPPPRLLVRAAALVLLLRLVIPLLALTSEGVYQLVLAPEYAAEQAQLKAPEFTVAEAPPDESLVDRMKRYLAEVPNPREAIEAVKQRAEGLAEHMIRLAAVFVVQTVLLPLLFLGMLGAAARAVFAPLRPLAAAG